MKQFTEEQVDAIIRLKWGRLVQQADGPTLTSNAALGKVFGVSGQKIRQLYMARFLKAKRQSLPFLE